MTPKVVLHVFPAAGTRFAKCYTSYKMEGREYVPLPVLSKELATEVGKQIREKFSRFKAAETGSMDTAIRLADVDDPARVVHSSQSLVAPPGPA